MKAQHTPGPWFVDQYNDHNVRNAIGVYATNRVIPIVHSIGGDSYAQADANTNLIAAAPALLAALEDLADIAEAEARVFDESVPQHLRCLSTADMAQRITTARAAIKLAKGEV